MRQDMSGSFVPSHDGSSQGDLTPKPMAHTDGRDAYQPLPSYLIDGEKETKEWLAALHGSKRIPAEPCACGVITERHVVVTVLGTPIREHAILLSKAQCQSCADQWEIAQLKRSLYTSPFAEELREDLRAGFEARLKELTKAVA